MRVNKHKHMVTERTSSTWEDNINNDLSDGFISLDTIYLPSLLLPEGRLFIIMFVFWNRVGVGDVVASWSPCGACFFDDSICRSLFIIITNTTRLTRSALKAKFPGDLLQCLYIYTNLRWRFSFVIPRARTRFDACRVNWSERVPWPLVYL